MLSKALEMLSKFFSKVFDVAKMKLDLDHLRQQNEQYRQELADKAMAEVFVEEDVDKIYTDTIIKMSNARLEENERLKARVAELEYDNSVLVKCIKEHELELARDKELVQRHAVEEQRLFDKVLDLEDRVSDLIEEINELQKPKARKKTGNSKT